MKFRTKVLQQEALLKGKKAYRKEELEDDKFYLVVDQDSADASIDIKGGQVFFGPFDSAEDAIAAAGADDANVVPGDDIDAVDSAAAPAEDGMGGAGDLNLDESGKPRAPRKPAATKVTPKAGTTESAAVAIRARVLKDIMKEAEALEVPTTIKRADGSTDAASGALDTTGVAALTNQTAAEIGTQHVNTDVKADSEPGFEGSDTIVKPSGAGTLDSNGGDLGSVNESTNPKYLTAGSFVRVYEGHGAGRKKCDQGVVHKMTALAITLEGNEEYPVDKYSFIQLAH